MNKRSGNNLIIIGAAPDVLVDLAAVPRVCMFDYMAIGVDAVAVTTYPLRYVVTYHPDDIPEIHKKRAQCGGNSDFVLISHEKKAGVDRVVPHKTPSGSSALLGVMAALEDGYEKIVLCGCPLIGKNVKGNQYASFQKGWKAVEGLVRGRVKSMSGWTAEFLSMPTPEWLLGTENDDSR